MNAKGENVVQTAYQIIITDDITGETVWNSGKVKSSRQSYVPYGTEGESEPSETLSTEPSVSPSVEPSASPSVEPSAEPSASPSVEPSETPSAEPSASPSVEPSETPSAEPSASPSAKPPVEPSPSAKPSDGYAVTLLDATMAGNTLTSVKAAYNKAVSASTVIAASYNADNSLSQASLKALQAGEAGTTETITFNTGITVPDGGSIKVFAWENIDKTMKPVSAVFNPLAVNVISGSGDEIITLSDDEIIVSDLKPGHRIRGRLKRGQRRVMTLKLSQISAKQHILRWGLTKLRTGTQNG